MAKHERVAISMEDVLDYTDAVQVMYDVNIVLELTVGVMGSTGKWRVTAKGYERLAEGQQKEISSSGRNYPSNDFRTFAGAALNAVMTLEQHLQAWYWLKNMGVSEGA